MANNVSQRQFLALKLEALSESEVGEVLDYISVLESSRRSKAPPLVLDDEVLAALADARENRRARQAFEWEAVRRKADRRAAAKVGAYSSMKKTVACLGILVLCVAVFGQDSRRLTPVQNEIETQKQRLSSSDQEERRDALMRLGTMRLPEASSAAVPALQDPLPIVRATAAKAILSIGADQSAGLLIPLLKDKDEFVRREAAYALGLTRSTLATGPLSEQLLKDK